MAVLKVRPLEKATLLEWTERGELLSRAELRVQILVRPPRCYRVCLLSAVYTPPERRRAGYARQLVALATAHIRRLEVDLAVLNCRRELIPLYASSGWQSVPTAVKPGSPSSPEQCFETMVFCCSEQALAAYEAISQP